MCPWELLLPQTFHAATLYPFHHIVSYSANPTQAMARQKPVSFLAPMRWTTSSFLHSAMIIWFATNAETWSSAIMEDPQKTQGDNDNGVEEQKGNNGKKQS